MSSSAGTVILEMGRLYSTQEALEVIVHYECEDGTSSSSEESEADIEEASEVETLDGIYRLKKESVQICRVLQC